VHFFCFHSPALTVLKSDKDASLSVEEAPATPNVTSSFPSISTATPTIANKSPYKSLFLGDLSLREISRVKMTRRTLFSRRWTNFVSGNLTQAYEGGLPRLHNKALNELREKADKNLSKTDNLAKDVDA
jgi:hypothetical protein